MSSRHHTGPPKKRFKSNHHDNTDDVLAKIDSKTKQIDELLAGFDNPNNSLNFIPSSLNKTSITAAPLPKPSSTHKSHTEVTKTITITATSFKIEHHTNTPTPPPPPPPHKRKNTHPTLKKLPLRPLPSPNAKPSSSCLRKTTFTTFRDEKRNKRRSSKSSKDTDSSHVHTADNEEKNKKRISFEKCVKNQDGVSAKFYSSPQYLIRDGTYLRPKPFQQIENEKRLLQMLGAPEELAGRALPPGLLDEDWEEMYDPQIPNDYSSFVTARQRLEEWIIMRKEQRNIAYQKAMMASQYAVEYIDSEIKKEREQEKASKRNRDRSHRDRYSGHKSSHRDRSDRERDRDRDRKRRSTRDRDRDRDKSRSRDRDRDYHRRRSSKSNDNKEYGSMGVLPTESPLEAMHCDVNANANTDTNANAKEENVGKLSGIDKAAKMMAKFGWKRGDGLGKSKQGLKGCLVPVGGYNQLMSVQDPTNVLLLQNMAGKGEVDMHLKAETIAECKNFGPVLDCIVHETIRKNVSREQQVSVFVKFEYIESCMNALQTFNGRFFDGRRVVASFFPLERFDSGDLEI